MSALDLDSAWDEKYEQTLAIIKWIKPKLGSHPAYAPYVESKVGKSTGKPAALKYATRTRTRGITLTRIANAGLNVGRDPWVRVPV